MAGVRRGFLVFVLAAAAVCAAAAFGALAARRWAAEGPLRGRIEREASAALGAELRIKTLSMEGWLRPLLVGGDVTLNARDGPRLAAAPRVEMSLGLAVLPRPSAVVRRIHVAGMEVRAGRGAGRSGVQRLAALFAGGGEPAAARAAEPARRAEEPRALRIGTIRLSGARLELEDPVLPGGRMTLIADGSVRTGAEGAPFDLTLRAPGVRGLSPVVAEGRLAGERRLVVEAPAVPAFLLKPCAPALPAACGGTLDARLEYAESATERRWSAELDGRRLCPGARTPAPALSARGVLRGSGVPAFSALLAGTTTLVRVTGSVPAAAGRPLSLVVTSTRADVGELTDWGLLLSSAAPSGGARVTGAGELQGRLSGPKGADFWSTASGTFTFRVKDGVLWNAPAILGVISKANLETLVRYARDGKRKGLPFKSLGGTVAVAGGKVTAADPIVLEADTLQIGVVGDIDASAKKVDARVVVRPLTIFDEIVDRIPIVRGLLHGDRDKSFVPLWFRVKGPVDDPSVRVMAGRTVGQPLWETIGRVFRLPADLIKDLRGKAK